ncbi:MAG: hypothetical protein ABDH49_07445 [Candidatus Hydrothermales bacterium]
MEIKKVRDTFVLGVCIEIPVYVSDEKVGVAEDVTGRITPVLIIRTYIEIDFF